MHYVILLPSVVMLYTVRTEYNVNKKYCTSSQNELFSNICKQLQCTINHILHTVPVYKQQKLSNSVTNSLPIDKKSFPATEDRI